MSPDGKGERWQKYDVVLAHNAHVPASQRFTNFSGTTGYTGLVEVEPGVVLLAYDRLEAIAGAGLNRSRSITDRGDFGQVWSVRVKVTASGGADPMRMHANDGNDDEEDDEKDQKVIHEPPVSGVTATSDFAQCVRTCKDLEGNAAPHLCHSLDAKAAPPLPASQVAVHAAHGGGSRDNFQYGQNGTEWRMWLPANAEKLTSISVFNSAAYGFSSSLNAGLLCAAHARGIRVVDSDIASRGSAVSAFVKVPTAPWPLANNNIAMAEYIEIVVQEMVAYGIDGFALDLEGAYTSIMSTAVSRASWTELTVRLKARMTEAVPGSQLMIWTTTTGVPWGDMYTPGQIAASVASVDSMLIMAYGLCPFMVANAPLPTISDRFYNIMGHGTNGQNSWGIPANKWMLIMPVRPIVTVSSLSNV